MLDETGFNLWADGYDKRVGLSDEEGSYPFAGYKKILNEIYNQVLSKSGRNILDIGFGTGTLTTKLYEHGCTIWGQDFSDCMLQMARSKMPKAHLYHGDFTNGLVEELRVQKYDAIIATYSLHHLTDRQKVSFLNNLLLLLNKEGKIYIGDIAFETRAALEECKRRNQKDWDEDEIYFVIDELKKNFSDLIFTAYSECAGLLELQKINSTKIT